MSSAKESAAAISAPTTAGNDEPQVTDQIGAPGFNGNTEMRDLAAKAHAAGIFTLEGLESLEQALSHFQWKNRHEILEGIRLMKRDVVFFSKLGVDLARVEAGSLEPFVERSANEH